MLAALPLLFLFVQALSDTADIKHELLAAQELEGTYHTATVWVLNTSLTAGDTVSEADFSKVILKTQDQTSLSCVTDPSVFDGYYVKTSLAKGCIATPEMFYYAEALMDDVRYVEATDLILPENMSQLDYVDIRLRFPNGEDYIVLSHKKLLTLLSDDDGTYGVQLELNEDELLRLSSARVDRDLYSDCHLYLLPYRTDFQESSTKNYPVNPDVFELMQWDPNILTPFLVPSELEKRQLLESHLEVFLQPDSDLESSFGTGDSDTLATENDALDHSESTETPNSITVYQP